MRTAGRSSIQTVQRVKVGMIGLAAVILLIGLASAVFSAASRERDGAAGVVNVAAVGVDANSTDSANEPLAELGVAPSADGNVADPAAKP